MNLKKRCCLDTELLQFTKMDSRVCHHDIQVHVNGQLHKRHVDELQPRYVEIVKDTADTYPRLPKPAK